MESVFSVLMAYAPRFPSKGGSQNSMVTPRANVRTAHLMNNYSDARSPAGSITCAVLPGADGRERELYHLHQRFHHAPPAPSEFSFYAPSTSS
jgi:hypothetical protein